MQRLLRAAALLCAVALASAAAAEEKGYKVGEAVPLQCKDWTTGEWGPGPICKETGRALGFSFGMDNFLYCGMELRNEAAYAQLKDIVALTKAWHCRVPVGADARTEHYVPFVVPLWGVAEGDILHLDNRVNFVFHAEGGRIAAAAAYPVRDRFQFVKPGATVSLHGPVRWFQKTSFLPLSGAAGAAGAAAEQAAAAAGAGGARADSCSPLQVLAWCAASATLSWVGAAVLYDQKLKPAIVRRCLKAR